MTYDETLAAHVRSRVGDHPGLSERELFGGIVTREGFAKEADFDAWVDLGVTHAGSLPAK